MSQYNTDNIPYQEYRSINLLRHAHPPEHEGKLRALVVFGDLVATGRSLDINLLEVLDAWSGRRHVVFENSPSIPLRGRLHLFFLTSEEFENPDSIPLIDGAFNPTSLLAIVREAYAVLLERPAGYAERVLERTELPYPLASGGELIEDPHSFFSSPITLQP